MTTLDTLFANAKTKFDLTEPADQESLYALTSALLELPDLMPDALQEAARRADAPLEFRLAAKLVDAWKYVLRAERPLNPSPAPPITAHQMRPSSSPSIHNSSFTIHHSQFKKGLLSPA